MGRMDVMERWANGNGNTSLTPSAAPAPGKTSRTQSLPGKAPAEEEVVYPLPPDIIEVLTNDDQYDVANKLEKYAKGNRSSGKDIKAAFDFLREHRGANFVEKVSDIMYPRDRNTEDWLGMTDFLHEGVNPGRDKARQAALDSEACLDDVDVDDQHVFSGIQLFIRVPDRELKNFDRMLLRDQVGPMTAGPYKIIACTLKGRLVAYVALHKERNQNEWYIGPDSIDAFVGAVDVYVGAAHTLLPGSPSVPDSIKGGNETPHTPSSVVQDEAFGNAPWQVAKGLGDAVFGETHGGTAAVGAYNGAMRIGNYVKPAKELAHRIWADVESGKINHLDGRQQAVDGRNALLEETRAKMTPGARAGSEAMKETGVTASKLEAKKTRELLEAYQGRGRKGKKLNAAQLKETRARLDANSPLWAEYAAAVEKDPELFGRALQSLGKSKEVSRAIISSAGRPNSKITGFAKFNMVAGGALAAYSIADMAYEIAEADEADRFHVAAHNLAGFAGGVIGAEGTIWMASLILGAGGAVGAPAMIVVSLIAGMAGGMIGSQAGVGLADMAMNMDSLGSLLPATGLGAAGGFAGLHKRGKPQGQNIEQRAADRIFELDGMISKWDRSMFTARNEEDLVNMQRKRLDLLEERSDLEDLLIAVKMGAFEKEVNASEPFEDPDAKADIPAPPKVPENVVCDPADDDCDVNTY